MENIIEIRNLDFGFNKNKKILKNVSLSVPKGSVYGFLGANGAGKSTTMRLIMGLFQSEHGNIKVFGQPVSECYPSALQNIGSLIDYPAFYDHLSGYDNLKLVCQIRNLNPDRIDEVLEQMRLSDARNMRMKKYSLGMKQRLAIGLALISNPGLLVLDEPVNGLDPTGMKEVREILLDLNKNCGTTIFISSHLLQEVDKMVTHLGIIDQGEMKFEGLKSDLPQLFQSQATRFFMPNAVDFLPMLPEAELLSETEISVPTHSNEEISTFNKQLLNAGAQVYRIEPGGGLEDWFMQLTKES